MSDQIPQSVKFIFLNIEKKHISNLIVDFIIIAKDKNNYIIGELITDKNGEIILTKEQMEIIISRNNLEFPMDYNGNLNSCIGIEIKVESEIDLKDRVRALREFYPADALFLENAINICNNNDLKLSERIQFPILDREITIIIR